MGRRRSPPRPAAWRSLSSRYEVRFSSSMSVDGHFDGLGVGLPPRTRAPPACAENGQEASNTRRGGGGSRRLQCPRRGRGVRDEYASAWIMDSCCSELPRQFSWRRVGLAVAAHVRIPSLDPSK